MRKIFAILVVILVWNGCSETTSDDTFLGSLPDTYVSLMENGWDAFLQSEFNTAVDRFQAAADRDATKPEPYLGLGWSYARGTSLDLEKATSNFQKTLSFSLFDPDLQETLENESYAGLAVVAYAAGDYATTINFVDILLDREPEFQMRKDPSVNAVNLNWMRLNSHFNLDHISLVYEELNDMDISFDNSNVLSVLSDVSEVLVINELTGLHEGTIALNGGASGLVTVSQISAFNENLDDNIQYTVTSINTGGITFEFQGNPLVSSGIADVSYTYAEDYGSFLNELLSKLINQ